MYAANAPHTPQWQPCSIARWREAVASLYTLRRGATLSHAAGRVGRQADAANKCSPTPIRQSFREASPPTGRDKPRRRAPGLPDEARSASARWRSNSVARRTSRSGAPANRRKRGDRCKACERAPLRPTSRLRRPVPPIGRGEHSPAELSEGSVAAAKPQLRVVRCDKPARSRRAPDAHLPRLPSRWPHRLGAP
jgi:hypothetical protein